MTCVEFRKVLPEVIDGEHTVEQDAHLRACLDCSSIVSDLSYIAQGARQLRSLEEPSPRVWNAIEITLRQEGLIHDPQPSLALVSPGSHSWRIAWLIPVAAALLVAAGLINRYARTSHDQALLATPATTSAPPITVMNSDDQQLLAAVSSHTPAMRATYEANLQAVNAYIRDAEETAHQNPNDEEAQQSVMDAYEQKNMVYEMAYDRSLR